MIPKVFNSFNILKGNLHCFSFGCITVQNCKFRFSNFSKILNFRFALIKIDVRKTVFVMHRTSERHFFGKYADFPLEV